MVKVRIAPFTDQHLQEVKLFIDRWCGENYLTEDDLKKMRELSVAEEKNSSFLAWVKEELAGVRLTLAPGKGLQATKGLSPEKWKAEGERVAYFKSLFVSEHFRNQGIGKLLSSTSLHILKEMGAQAVVCHSWLESPENSSQKYLASLGFERVASHPRFWSEMDYFCVRCAPERCVCTAIEMIKYLRGNSHP